MRLIRVLRNYGGHATNDQRIEPGVYSEDDPKVFGAGDYLIQNGHAELAGVAADPQPIEPPPAEEEAQLPEDPAPPKRKK